MLGNFVAIGLSAVAVAMMGTGATTKGAFAAFSWRLYKVSVFEMVNRGTVTVSTVW